MFIYISYVWHYICWFDGAHLTQCYVAEGGVTVSLSRRWGSFFFRLSCSEHRDIRRNVLWEFHDIWSLEWSLLDLSVNVTRITDWRTVNEVLQENLCHSTSTSVMTWHLSGWYVVQKINDRTSYTIHTDDFALTELPKQTNFYPASQSNTHILFHCFFNIIYLLSGPRNHPSFFFIQHRPHWPHLPWPSWNWC